MITKLSHVSVYVHNQEDALAFYTQKLGFVLHTDAQFGQQVRWLTVCAKDQKDVEISLLLAESAEEKALVGKQAGSKPLLAFIVDDCEKTHDMLKKNDVKIFSTPEKQDWGTSMAVLDLYGNIIYLVEQAY